MASSTTPDPRGAARAAELAADQEDWHRVEDAALALLAVARRRKAERRRS